ncbi:MAG: ABC transporter ATP-binding protein [Sphingobacteriaceae bacterium]|nr:ABC transporter ATP-binding protein [Sphingobacteriaceae bacterium]
MKKAILSVKNLSKQYQENKNSGIQDISFDLYENEFLAIIGESGSGKSTLLKSIYGLLQTDAGEIIFQNEKIKGPNEQLIPGHKKMKMVTQDFSLNIYAKVYDNIAAMLPNTDIKHKQEKTMQIMERLQIVSLKDKKITELSGGEQQRVAIAKALVCDTEILLLDEPFSQLDSLLKNQLRNDLKNLISEMGISIVLVSHDPADGLLLGDKILVLRNGTLLQIDTIKKVYNEPNTPYTAKLLGNANVLTKQEATQIGIKTNANKIAFYPQWVSVKNNWLGKKFEIENVFFKGFYDELTINCEGIRINALQLNNSYKKNDQVQLNIDRFIEF